MSKQKTLKFVVDAMDWPVSQFKPEIGEQVYIVESQTLFTGNDPRCNIKAGDTSKPAFRLSRECPRTSPGGQELEEGWLGAYCGNNTQKDSWSLGLWEVKDVIDLPTNGHGYTVEEVFKVKLVKVS